MLDVIVRYVLASFRRGQPALCFVVNALQCLSCWVCGFGFSAGSFAVWLPHESLSLSLSSSPGHEGVTKPLGRKGPPVVRGAIGGA